MGDRDRTCITRICNPSPNHSVAHPHISGTACRNRTHIRRVEAYCILHYTNAVMAEELRFELREHFCSAVFKTAGLNHSPTLPKTWLLSRDSNPNEWFWRPLCCHYITEYLVRLTRIELVCCEARDFKSLVSTYFTTVAL